MLRRAFLKMFLGGSECCLRFSLAMHRISGTFWNVYYLVTNIENKSKFIGLVKTILNNVKFHIKKKVNTFLLQKSTLKNNNNEKLLESLVE